MVYTTSWGYVALNQDTHRSVSTYFHNMNPLARSQHKVVGMNEMMLNTGKSMTEKLKPAGTLTYVVIVDGKRVDIATDSPSTIVGKVVGYINKRGGVTAL